MASSVPARLRTFLLLPILLVACGGPDLALPIADSWKATQVDVREAADDVAQMEGGLSFDGLLIHLEEDGTYEIVTEDDGLIEVGEWDGTAFHDLGSASLELVATDVLVGGSPNFASSDDVRMDFEGDEVTLSVERAERWSVTVQLEPL